MHYTKPFENYVLKLYAEFTRSFDAIFNLRLHVRIEKEILKMKNIVEYGYA